MNNQYNLGNMSYERDFSNPEDAKEVLEHLGGEALLKEKFPKVYQAFLNTVAKHKEVNLLKANGELDGAVVGLQNGAFATPITLKPFGKKLNEGKLGDSKFENREVEGVITATNSVQGTDEWAVAYLSGYMKNETDGNMIHTFGQRTSGTNSYETLQKRDSRDLNQFGNQILKNYIECTAVKLDNTMVSLKAESKDYVLNGSSSNIVYMSIDDPRSKLNNNPILMMYARKPDPGETADYDYPNNNLIPGTDTVKTLFPVKGKITFNDDLIPIGYNADLSKTPPSLKYTGKGVCTYNYTQKEIASCFKISSTNPQVVEFQLKEDWKAILDISAYAGHLHEGNVGFEFSFFITTKIKGTEATLDQAVAVYSTVSLEEGQTYYDSKDDTNAYLPLIFMRWGCFGKDTKILMADRSEKLVSEILKGDQIMGDEGMLLVVSGTVSGHEENICCIMTKGGKRLEVTKDHPVATKEGALRARDITPKMLLICENGSEDEVEFNYLKSYEDTVYNIETEGGSNWVVANGILAGNLAKQNDNLEIVMAEKLLSEETLQLKAEFDQLLDHLNVL